MLENQPMHPYGAGYYFREIGISDSKGFFGFARAVKNFRFEGEWDAEKKLNFTRCDTAAPRNLVLPSGFHEWDYDNEVCSCGLNSQPFGTTNDHHVCLTKCEVFRIPIQTQNGFIAFFQYKEPEEEILAMQMSECNGRTLQEVFRCILEWQWVHLNMSNNEIVAVAANDFISNLDMPEEILNWLWEAVPDQHVARYLRGVESPRMRQNVEDTPDMTNEFNLWAEYLITEAETLWPYGPR